MNDLDPWDDPEGSEPEERDEAASGVPDPTPEEEEMERRLFEALAVDGRRWERRQALRRGLRWGLAAACGVGGMVLVVRLVGREPQMSMAPRARVVVEERHSVEAAATESVDAGVARRRR